MQMEIWKCLVPCSIVTGCTILLLVMAWIPRPANDVESILSELEHTDNLSGTERRLNQYISFLDRISNPNEPLLQQSIYAVRFEAAAALSERNDTSGNTAAVKQYQRINQVDPSYNHGWLQFLLADMYQKLGQWTEAADAYAQVMFYNHSRLALRAKFLEAMIRSEQLNESVNPFDIYCYLRFASEYPFNDASITSNWNWKSEKHTAFIKALALYDAGNSAEALQIMPSNIHDPSTEYYRSVFRKNEVGVNSISHSLLQSAYYNGSVFTGSVMLEEGYSLLSDFYVMGRKPGSHSLELHYSHSNDGMPSFEILLNQTKVNTIRNHPDLQTVMIDFVPNEGRNILEIRWFKTQQRMNQTSPPTVQVHDIKVQ